MGKGFETCGNSSGGIIGVLEPGKCYDLLSSNRDISSLGPLCQTYGSLCDGAILDIIEESLLDLLSTPKNFPSLGQPCQAQGCMGDGSIRDRIKENGLDLLSPRKMSRVLARCVRPEEVCARAASVIVMRRKMIPIDEPRCMSP